MDGRALAEKIEVKLRPPKKWDGLEDNGIVNDHNDRARLSFFGGKSWVNFQGQIMLHKLPALILPRPEVSFAQKTKRNEVVLIRAEKHNKQAVLYQK